MAFVASGNDPNFTYGWKAMGVNGLGLPTNFQSVPTGLSAQGAAATNSATQELMNTLGNTVADEGQSEADTAQAQGYQNEVGAYTSAEGAYGGVESAYQTAAGIANQNATLEQAAGDIQAYQEGLQAQQTIGAQRSAVAASGFANSGSALSLLASSSRQAALTQSLSHIQTNINVGGYKEQATAAEGQTAAAQAQEASVGAQAAAASGAANAATAAATAASRSANFNQALAVNDAANLAQLEAPLSGMPGSTAASIEQLQQQQQQPNPTLNAAATAFRAAGVTPPSQLPAPVTPTTPGSVPIPQV